MFKNLVKSAIYRMKAKAPEQIIGRLKGYSVVSFDVFDTLLKRDVANPQDVFMLMEMLLPEKCGIEIGGFAQRRQQAEKTARQVHPGREVTLEEIYACMPYEPAIREKLMDLEAKTEMEVSTPNLPMKELYSFCVEEKKDILFISDMYLPAEVIQNLLVKNGYEMGKLYVSSQTGMTKRNGSLFEYVRGQEGIRDGQWVHIGDTVASDYLVPKRMGIKAFLIERTPKINKYVDRRTYRKSPGYRKLNHFINIRLSRYENPYERIGYAVLGPLLYGFSRWLEREIPEDETVVFLARDGALLQRAFKLLSFRSTVYMHISRRAAYAAMLDKVPDVDAALASGIRAIKKYCTHKQFAISCGVSAEEAEALFDENGLSENDIVLNTDQEHKALSLIWPLVKRKTSGQHSLLNRYFEQLGITEKCALVDIGWKGTIQALLEKTSYSCRKRPIQWKGYYLGSMDKDLDSSYKEISRKSFLFDRDSHQRIYECFRNTIPFCEMFFLSTDGTTEMYAEASDGKTIPVLSKPENNKNEAINMIQAAGLQFVKDMHSSSVKLLINNEADSAAGNYLALAELPSLETLNLFRIFEFYDGYAYHLVSEHTLAYYLVHPKQFIHDFISSGSRTWFLKSIFKLPFPYIQGINLLRKIYKLSIRG